MQYEDLARDYLIEQGLELGASRLFPFGIDQARMAGDLTESQ